MRAPLSLLLLLATAALVTACGGAPSYPYVLQAPDGVERWEPSAAVRRGDLLWVVTDRDGWVAAYALPLKTGLNLPVRSMRLAPFEGRIKWEGLAPLGDEGFLLLETMTRSLYRCPDPAAGCAGLERVDPARANAAIDALLPGQVEYVTLEGLAGEGDRVYLGARGYVAKGLTSADFTSWSVVSLPDGTTTLGGAGWPHGGRSYGLSGMAADGSTLWMTWSFEDERDDRPEGVGGLLARAPIDPATGLPGRPRLCRTLDGKPEGIAVLDRDHLVLVFDDDKARKDPSRRDRFALTPTQDFATVLRKADCPADGEAMP